MQIAARVISAILSVYMILLMIRVMLTWFRGPQNGQFFYYLSAVTDPYLNWFRRFSKLRTGMLDFSPILAFVLLGFIINILTSISTYGRITVGVVLALLINGIWSIISFIIIMFVILAVMRLLSATLFREGILARMSPGLDSVIEPIISWVRRTIFRNRFTPYTTQLWVSIALLIVLNILLRILFAYLTKLVVNLPF
ncbi:MAG: YggT family protein [Spirochaetales bacterium]|nr:YggT family protein [Spirochaetales bacterium]